MRLATDRVSGKIEMAHESGQRCLQRCAGQRTHVLIHRFLSDFEDISAHVTKYDAALKYIFLIFKNLFLLISAVNSYVLFTSDFPNALSQVFVFMLSLNQLGLIYRFMSLAAVPAKRVASLTSVMFAMQVRLQGHLSRRQEAALLRCLEQVNSQTNPISYTDGQGCPFESSTMTEFVMGTISLVIMFLQSLWGSARNK